MKRFPFRAALVATFCLSALSVDAADLERREAVTVTQVVSPGLWRGHFSGGFNYDPPAPTIALAWTDQVEFFPDDLSCRRWMRGLRAQYRTYQGFGGCLRIR